jgi:hypothetical protein
MRLGTFRLPRCRDLLLCLALLYIILQSALWRIVGSQSRGSGTPLTGPQRLGYPTPIGPVPVLTYDLDREIQSGIDYARSITNVQRKLVFVHIPKSAGSAIEEVGGLQARLAWGSCLFLHRPRRPGGVCRYPEGQFEWPSNIGYWHLPTQLFPLLGTDPYRGADLFAVVREPRDRLVSEFYYVCRKKVKRRSNGDECNVTKSNDPGYMNGWLKEKLHRLPAMGMSANDYLDHNGHFTPQSHFVFSSFDVRMVDYVLRMDTLQTDFPRLMDAYGLDVKLPSVKTNTARNSSADLDAESIDSGLDELIREKYLRDFDFFA